MNTMEQGSAMREEDMFYEAEAPEVTEDEMYITLVQSIAVKKCRIEQKKEKIKQVIQKLDKLNADLKAAKMRSGALLKEKEEHAVQQNFKALSLKGVKESRASFERALSDLTNKVAAVEKETKDSNDEYTTAIQNSLEKWECYKEIYEEFPLAKKRRDLIIELKKVDIGLRILKFDIEDMKYKEKLKNNIADKRDQINIIKIAKAYHMRKEKTAERDALRMKERELKLKLEEMKAGKFKSNPSVIFKPIAKSIPRSEPQKTAKPSFLQLKMPDISVPSPPQLTTTDGAKQTGLSSWQTLFSTSLPSIPRKIQTKQVGASKLPNLPEKRVSQHINTNKTLPERASQDRAVHRTATIVIEQPAINSMVTECVGNERKVNNRMLGKRTINSQAEKMIENQQSSKKVKFNESQKDQTNLDVNNSTTKEIVNKDQAERKINEEIKKTPSGSETKQSNQENLKNVKARNSSSGIKSLMSILNSSKALSIPNMTASMTTNVKGTSSTKPKSQQNVYQRQADNLAFKGSLRSFDSQKPLQQTRVENQNTTELPEDESNRKQPDNILLTMVPTPPDVIPVENCISQPESSGHTSLPSDFISPSELDEVAKLHYQRIAAESPEFLYTKGPELAKPQQSGVEIPEVVRSQYFPSNLPTRATHSQDLSQSNAQGEEDQMPYSMPGNNSLEINNDAFSPPTGEMGYFGFGDNAQPVNQLFNSKPTSPEGSNSPDGQFGFSFMSNPSKKSSLFSLF